MEWKRLSNTHVGLDLPLYLWCIWHCWNIFFLEIVSSFEDCFLIFFLQISSFAFFFLVSLSLLLFGVVISQTSAFSSLLIVLTLLEFSHSWAHLHFKYSCGIQNYMTDTHTHIHISCEIHIYSWPADLSECCIVTQTQLVQTNAYQHVWEPLLSIPFTTSVNFCEVFPAKLAVLTDNSSSSPLLSKSLPLIYIWYVPIISPCFFTCIVTLLFLSGLVSNFRISSKLLYKMQTCFQYVSG